MSSPSVASIEISSLRRALRLINTKRDLSLNPLSQLECVRILAEQSHVSREAAVRQILLRCIEKLRPVSPGNGNYEDEQAFAV